MMIGGKPRHFKKKKVAEAENTLIALLYPHKPVKPFDGPVEFYVNWTYPWRSAEPKKHRVAGFKWNDKRPDCSNIVKLLEDCMTKLLFWNDDSQIARLIVEKQWGDNPGFKIRIKELHPNDQSPV